MAVDTVVERARALEAWGAARAWRGADPYDGLNARRAGRLRRHPLGLRVLTQAVKRSPVDLRPALGIPPADDAAALGAVASAYARNGFLEEPVARERLARTLARLGELRSPRVEEPAW